MGKAIIIPGLVVTNPLKTVTFADAASILAAYYAANGTINDSEKTALEAFIDGLVENGFWNKVHYLYPMLGNAVADAILDVVNPATEDLLSGGTTTGLSIVDRTLRATNERRSIDNSLKHTFVSGSRFYDSIDPQNLSVVFSEKINGTSPDISNGNVVDIWDNSEIVSGLIFGTESGGYRSLYMSCGRNGGSDVILKKNSSEASYKERIGMADYDNAVARLYKDNDVLATGTNYITKPNAYCFYREQLQAMTNIIDYKFLMFTEHLTAEEWNVVYNLLTTFLTAVGKRS